MEIQAGDQLNIMRNIFIINSILIMLYLSIYLYLYLYLSIAICIYHYHYQCRFNYRYWHMLLRKHIRTRENSSGNKWTPSYYGEWTNGITLKLWIYRPILRQLPPWNLFSRSLPTAWNYEPHVNASHWWNDMKIVNAADTNLTAANTGVRNRQLLLFLVVVVDLSNIMPYAASSLLFYAYKLTIA